MSLNPATAALSGSGASLEALRLGAAKNPKGAVQEAARQFESLFMQELLKNMRSGSLGADWLDNDGAKLGKDLLDGQLAGQVSGQPGGLGELIARQLEKQLGTADTGQKKESATMALQRIRAARRTAVHADAAPAGSGSQRASSFVQQHQQAARAAEAKTGIPAAYIIGQAAHESGWGRHEIRNADGSTSHNLFGIKAGGNWKGEVAQITTTEYVDGVPRKVVAKFRAYGSYQDAFLDWASLIKNSPRYAQVVAEGQSAHGFAQGLQRAGYATDPAYADKLGRVIQMAQRLQHANS